MVQLDPKMMGVFAMFLRAMIRERVKSGLERAKAQVKTRGRPPIGCSVRSTTTAADPKVVCFRNGRSAQGAGGGEAMTVRFSPPSFLVP